MGTLLSSGSLLQALAPEMALAGGAMLLLLLTVWHPQGNVSGSAEGAERTSTIARFAMVLCILVAMVVVIAWGDQAGGTPDGRIAGDGFRWAVDLIVLAGTALSLLLLDADHARSGAYSPEVPVLILLAACGMMVLAAARDLMIVFLGIELMSLAIYVLAGVNRRSARGAEAALKYFLLGSFSTGFLLYGMALVFGATGSTKLTDIAAWVSAHAALTPMFRIGLGLLLVGFCFKIAAAPFHLWTPDVYDGAPLPVTAFMSAIVKLAAFATFARVMSEGLTGAIVDWHSAVWWLAAITMVVGNVLALAQRNLVRMLAYSSIAHAGYVLTAIVVNSPDGRAALLFYFVSYTLATMGAFAVLIAVNDGQDRSPTLDDLAGLWQSRPSLAIAMAVFFLAFLGMPLAGGMGFFAKWYLLQAALQSSVPQIQLAVVLVLSSVVSAGYYLSVLSSMFMTPRAEGRSLPSLPSMTQGMVAALALLLILLGVYPTPVARFAHLATVAAPAAPAEHNAQPKRIAPFSAASAGASILP